MADTSKTRMNLAAIKKVDPYAKDIVDTSSHVAFYIFNSEQNEWEKTDVEGAFFIYSRNAQPFHSIFINNRLNTTSFVEPITSQLELQAQAPFLLYRNERSRIRGFWFYNSLECDRISKLVSQLVQTASSSGESGTTADNSTQVNDAKENNNVNIFKMLSNAQQEFNNSTQNKQQHNSNNSATPNNINSGQLVTQHTPTQNIASGNVLKFFESAKPTAEVSNFTTRILPNTLSVEQLEKQQRDIAPNSLQSLNNSGGIITTDEGNNPLFNNQTTDNITNRLSCSLLEPAPRPGSGILDIKPIISRGPDFGFAKALTAATCTSSQLPGEQISLSKIFSNLNLQQSLSQTSSVVSAPGGGGEVVNKPALMPPTMFDKPAAALSVEPLKLSSITPKQQEPLDKYQFMQAFNYLIQNDDEFVQKLHEAYLKTVSKFGTYQ
ncbi:hypothetical protein DOY81_000171 [Sarcophaga bullata]|nr:hypothetical protein DOY81_000171 [Sarcophaga bullata]